MSEVVVGQRGERSNSKSKALSQIRRKKATTTQLDSIHSDEEFNLRGIEGDDDTPNIPGPLNDAPGPSDHMPELVPWGSKSQPASRHVAHDVLHFFTEIKFPNATKDNEKLLKVCNLCAEVHRTNKNKVPSSIANYFYRRSTGNSNLQDHLRKRHPKEYDQAVVEHRWNYKLSTQSDAATAHKNTRNVRDQGFPPFSAATFLDHLAHFIIADDQSIRVVERPEFRHLCMLLCETLVDADISHRDKMREVIISLWQKSFETLKLDLSHSSGQISFTSDAGVTLNIGHFTLDNAENNAVAMQELQFQLSKRETAIVVNFDHLNHRVRCYAHIINICSSHVVASMTPTSKSYLSQLKVPTDSNYVTCDNFDNELDDSNINLDHDLHQLEPADFYDDRGDPKLRRWFSGIKRDPIRRAL
ncbi:hypothetical protein BJY52DRAFT_1198561 [Lactarius psammicola]|nr:hypothetical protein BJY52DRAFT_1198561 [Lactarius psammicola]